MNRSLDICDEGIINSRVARSDFRMAFLAGLVAGGPVKRPLQWSVLELTRAYQ